MKPEIKSRKAQGVDRRNLLKAVLGGAGAATTAVVLGSRDVNAKAENVDERKRARYKNSEHVQRYYETNRF